MIRRPMTGRIGVIIAVTFVAGAIVNRADAVNYRLERIASGLNQPTYVTQAPGDPANILYYTERTLDANPGFGAVNDMGRVWRYDTTTRAKTMVLDLSQYFVTNDTGLQTVAFHPDFNTPASAGFGKMYVSHAEASGSPSNTARNRVEEYTVDIGGPAPTYAAAVNRTILQYDNNAQNNHTIDWIGFDPTATGADRNNLYISTGDGAFGLNYNGGTSPTGRPSQNPSDVAGKMLRVDVVGADAYPGDPLRNFAIPASNPIPTYNAANPGSPISGFGEVYLTGLRNTYRASFDRQTGDLWMGDVGENMTEEVNFLKAGTNVAGPPVDYGWPQREGTAPSGINGTTGATVNPFTGVTSLESVWQFPRAGAAAAIGGYLYRGPVSELQGKYFYSNFVGTGQAWMLDFDRDTNPASFNGANGINTEVSALWQSLVFDPTDPTYAPDSTTGSSAGLDHIVSFGEDNAGNLYIVDFGNGSGFNGQYPGAGFGEIFKIVPVLGVAITVDRVSGDISFANSLGEPVDVRGYSIASSAGALNSSVFTPVTNRLDAPPIGDGTIDPTNDWQITSTPGSHTLFSEASTGGATTLSTDETFELSPDGGWIKSIYEDLNFKVTLGDGSIVDGIVEYTGNGGEAYARSDLNFNNQLDPDDWTIFRTNHLADMTGLSKVASYALGDLDGDGDNDFSDFRLFQADYISFNGEAAFAKLLSVPEPASMALLAMALAAAFGCRSRRWSQRPKWIAAVVAASTCLIASHADAVLVRQYTFNEGNANDSAGVVPANGTLHGNATISSGVLNLPGGNGGGTLTNGDYLDLPGDTIDVNSFTDVTFEAWFTISNDSGWQRVFDFGNTSGGGQGQDYFFYSPTAGTGDNRAAMRNTPSFGEVVASAGPPLPLNTRHHVAVVVDDDVNGGANQLTVYVNGEFGDDAALNLSLSNLSSNFAYLGRSLFNADPFMTGSIDEFRIYNHALSASEVEQSFLNGPVPVELLELEVNTVTGLVTVKNQNSGPLQFDYYRIASPGGALRPAAWNSLDDQDADAVGTGTGQSWDVLASPNSNEVAEGYLLNGSTVASQATLNLGKLYDPSLAGTREEGDLIFEFGLKGVDELQQGVITYIIPPPLLGDYNDDGTVDAADYTVWRDNLNTSFQLPNEAPGVTPNNVTVEDYQQWKLHFGESLAGSGASFNTTAAVPEPATLILMVLASACMSVMRR